MSFVDTEEGRRRVETLVTNFLELRPKLQRQARHLSTLRDQGRRRLAEGGLDAEQREFYQAHVALSDALLDQIRQFDLDRTTYVPPSPEDLLVIQLAAARAQFYTMQLKRLNLGRVYAVVAADLDAALAGAGGASVPAAWREIREAAQADAQVAEALRRFVLEYPEFEAVMAEAAEAVRALDGQPASPALLGRFQELGLPKINGLLYRLEACFRGVPQGDALLQEVALGDLDLQAGATPSAPSGKKGGLTDRLKEFWTRHRPD